MKVQVSTSEFEFAHGRKPRGFGSWAFFFGDSPEPQWFVGTFAGAKQQAVVEAARRGVDRVRVGS